MAEIAPLGKFRAFDDNGDPLSGGKLYTYEAGTTTPKASYTTSAGNVSNSNPVILDDAGYANVWLGDGGYKFKLTDANDVEQFTTDNIGGSSNTAFASQVNAISTNTTITNVYANSANICTGTITLSLIAASSAGEGFYFLVKNAGSGIVTIDPDASETIDGVSSLAINPGLSALIICNGTTWYSFFLGTVSTTSAKTTTYAVVGTDKASTILCDASGGAFTVTLLAAATAGNGFTISFKKTDSSANAVTIDGSGSETIDGALTRQLGNQYNFLSIISNGTTWYILSTDAGAVPIGGGYDYWGTTAPANGIFPYGQSISRTTYAALFALFGTTYGVGDGSTTFGIPDKRGRASFGKDDMGGSSANRITNQSGGWNGDDLGAAGGSETHALTSGENGPHTHTIAMSNDDGGNTLVDQAGPTGTGTLNTGSSGSGTPHNNLPPGITCNYVIRAF